jgi:hypothetical protein
MAVLPTCFERPWNGHFWSISWPFSIILHYGIFMVICIFSVLVCCRKKNLANLVISRSLWGEIRPLEVKFAPQGRSWPLEVKNLRSSNGRVCSLV